MAKIPIILESGRADGKLAESQTIYDSILKQFQSDINREYKLTKQQVEFLLPIVERLNDVQDTLTSIEADKPLSAQQGKILKELLDAKVIESGNVPMDAEPTDGNTDHVVTSDGIRKSFNKVNDKINLSKNEEAIYPSDIFNQININEYIYVQLDSNNKLIFGILPDGDIVYGFGVPSQIKEYIESIKTELLNKINDAATKEELTTTITVITETLNKKVNKEEGKELIDSEVNSTKFLYENGEYISIEIDESGHLLEARLLNGTKVIYTNIETQSVNIETNSNPNFVELHLDNNNKLLYGITSTGDFIFGIGIPSKIQESINNIDNKIKDVTTLVTPIIQNEDSREELIRMFKSMICCGDSVTHGHIFYNGRGSAISSLFSYPTQLGKMFPEINITNAGQSGQSIPGWNKSNFYNYDFTKFDLCLIELGWNSGKGPLYDTFDTDVAPYGDNYEQYADTGMGNYCQLIKKIEKANPYIFICLVCPKGWRGEDSFYKGMRNAVKHIGQEFNLPVIDLADDSLYPLNYEDAYAPTHPESRGVHSSPLGYLIKATYIKQGIGRAISEFSEKAIKCCFGRNNMMCKVTITVNDETLISTNVDYTEVLACYTSILECTLLNQNAIFDGWFYNNEKLSEDLIFTFDPYVKFSYSVPKAITIEARAHSK